MALTRLTKKIEIGDSLLNLRLDKLEKRVDKLEEQKPNR
jgi:hypothetical protein